MLARAHTERLGVVLASLVLGVSGALLLPLLLPFSRAAPILALVLVLVALPYVLPLWFWRRRGLPKTSWPALAPPLGVSSLLVALALVPILQAYRGQVRVLNLGEEPFLLFADGRLMSRVNPSSGESARAGAQLVMPAGLHELALLSIDQRRELGRFKVVVSGGKPHLFAPFAEHVCFEIERRHYGARAAATERERLTGPLPFWVLPHAILWFEPAPEASPLRTSGGSLSALRQRRCSP